MAKISSKGIAPDISESILNYLNSAKNAEEIDSLGPIAVGDYNIGELVAQRIIDKRDKLGGFTDLSQLSDIKGFGIDKFNELVAVFASASQLPSEGRYEPLFRFASLRYHSATIPATKSSKRKSNEGKVAAESMARRLSKTENTELERAHVASLAKEDIHFIKGLSRKLENLVIEYNNSKQEALKDALKESNELIQSNIQNYEKSLTKEEKKVLDDKKRAFEEKDSSSEEQTENSLDAVYPSSLFPSFEFKYITFSSSEYFEDKLTIRELSFLDQNNLLNIDTIALNRGLNNIINEKRRVASYSNLKWKKKVIVGGTPVVLKNRYKNGYVLSIDKQNKLLHLSLITAKAKSYFITADVSLEINGKLSKSSNTKLVENDTNNMFLESSFDNLPGLDFAQSFTFELSIELNTKEKIVIKETVSSHNDIWVGQYLPDTRDAKALRTTVDTPIKDLNGILRLGWADLMRVEQKLCCYLPGEVSHIENIMAREYKEKSTEYLERSENTIVEENETETIEKNDTTSVEKHDWNKEISKTIEKNFNFGLGTAVSYSAGPWSMSINANMSIANSQSQASTNAQSYSKEITESASESIRVRSFEKRTTTLIKQFKEENKHGFDNRLGENHVSGVFRWIDKIYKNQIFNYGRGMLYEFMIPKPSELYVETLADLNYQDPLTEPTPPDLNSWHDVTRDNYMTHINGYKVKDYQPPLPDTETDRFTTGRIEDEFDWFHINQSSATRNYTFPTALAANYDLHEVANTSFYQFEYHNPGGVASHFQIDLRNSSTTRLLASTSNYSGWNGTKQANMSLTNLSFSNQLEVYIYGTLVKKILHCDLDFVYKLKNSVFQQWQQDTYNAIMDAYQEQLDAYNAALALQQTGITNDTGDDDKYKHPGQYQEIINTEIKRLCIELLLQDTGLDRCQEFYVDDGCSDSPDCEDIPTLTNLDKLDDYSAMVKFLEQSFNWSLFSYNLYPYYWGGKCDWADMLHNEDTPDNEFQKFLKSGMARVIVPVREGFEKVVAHYISTGIPWFNGEPPVITDPNDPNYDPLYLSIVDELKKPVGDPVGAPWNTNVPSNLTLIQGDTVYLQNQGLPCCEDVSGGGGSGISPSKNKLEAKEDSGE